MFKVDFNILRNKQATRWSDLVYTQYKVDLYIKRFENDKLYLCNVAGHPFSSPRLLPDWR